MFGLNCNATKKNSFSFLVFFDSTWSPLNCNLNQNHQKQKIDFYVFSYIFYDIQHCLLFACAMWKIYTMNPSLEDIKQGERGIARRTIIKLNKTLKPCIFYKILNERKRNHLLLFLWHVSFIPT